MTGMLRGLADRYDQLSLRERLLVMGAVFLMLVLLWDSLLMGGLDRQRKQRSQQVVTLQAEVARLNAAIEDLAKAHADDPEYALRRRAAELQAQITALDEELQGLTDGLVAPRQMNDVLEAVLQRAERMHLKSLRTLPSTPLVRAGAASTDEEAAELSKLPQLWRHAVTLEFEGSYLDTLALLESLESLGVRFFWERISLTVDEHPRASVTLTVSTLSQAEGWIGV